VTSTEADITGATLTFSTVGTNTVCVVIGCFNFSIATGATGSVDGKCNVDAVNQADFCRLALSATSMQCEGTQVWMVSLAASGSHTIKLRAVNNSGQTVATNNNGNTTTLTVLQLTA
jgi:hypothetical protein